MRLLVAFGEENLRPENGNSSQSNSKLYDLKFLLMLAWHVRTWQIN
jgi:hypothetical protein